MKHSKILHIALAVIMCFSLFSCTDGDGASEAKIINTYRFPDGEKYFTAYATTDVPALDGFKFNFPIITDCECEKAENLRIYSKGELIELDSVNNLNLIEEYLSNKDKSTGWRYLLSAELNKHNMGNSLDIDCIKVTIDGVELSYDVDISIRYEEAQSVHKMYFHPVGDSKTAEGMTIKCKIVCGVSGLGGTITAVSGAILERETTEDIKITDIDGNEYDAIGFTFERTTTYGIEINLPYPTGAFTSDALILTVQYEDETVEYCTSENRLYIGNVHIRFENEDYFPIG